MRRLHPTTGCNRSRPLAWAYAVGRRHHDADDFHLAQSILLEHIAQNKGSLFLLGEGNGHEILSSGPHINA